MRKIALGVWLIGKNREVAANIDQIYISFGCILLPLMEHRSTVYVNEYSHTVV